MEKTKINIGKKNAKNRYLKSLWGGPHGENEKKLEKQKKYLKSLWGGPHGETKKRLETQKKKLKSLWGGPHGENQKKNGKTKKQKNTNILRLLAYPSPSPRLLFFFLVVFPSFLFFSRCFFFKVFFWAFRLRRSVGGGVVSERRASNMPCAANVEGFN